MSTGMRGLTLAWTHACFLADRFVSLASSFTKHAVSLSAAPGKPLRWTYHCPSAGAECRGSKLVSTIVSTFTAYYVHLWPTYFQDVPFTPPLPSFDGRAVCYPSVQNLRDYMSWRQVDCMCSPSKPSLPEALLTVSRPHQQPVQHNLLGPHPARWDGCHRS
jgi:hypothetical protein